MTEEKNVTTPETKAPATTTEKTPKKKHTALIVVIIVLVVLLILGIGGFFLSAFVINKFGKNVVEKAVETGTGGKVNLDTDNGGATVKTDEGDLNVGSSAKWPTDLPAGIPKFTDGKVTMSTKVNTDPKAWSIILSEVTEAESTKYKNELIANGWVEESSMNFGASLTQLTKDNLGITLTYDASSQGLSITVSYKS